MRLIVRICQGDNAMNSAYTPSVTERLKLERKRLGLSQDAVAEKCGVRRDTWSRYERGLLEPGSAVLRAFVLLGADPKYIVTGDRTTDEERSRWVQAIHLTESRKDKLQDLFTVLEKLSEDDLDIIMGLASRMRPNN